MRLLILMFSLISLSSCIKVEPPQPLPLYSVYGILNPSDTTIKIFLGKTFSINESFSYDSLKFVPGAKIFIETHNKTRKQLFLNNDTKEYETPNNGFLIGGNTYYLKISVNGDTLTASTRIPNIATIKLEEKSINNNICEIVVSWDKNLESEYNNFRLIGHVNTNSPIIPGFYWGSDLYLRKINGNDIEGNKIFSPTGSFDITDFSDANISIQLETLDSILYDFIEKLDAVQTRTSFTKKFESPIFFKSNVKNGSGVFGSMTKSELIISLK
ncbi:MAG: DUF4249 family protein [Spirosomataceae bacterium]